MKIGILTQPLGENYGGILQNYALQQVLIRLGHKPITIDRHINRPKSVLKNFVKKLYRTFKTTYDTSLLTAKERERLSMQQLRFIDRYISRTPRIYTQTDFDRFVADTDLECFIVGSDQCWRPCYSANIVNYYLDFASSINIKKKIAYAASFGVDNWEYTKQQEESVKYYAQLLDAVSVRENSGQELCRRYLGVEAEWVLDPTMLLGRAGFNCFITHAKEVSFITTYMLEYTPDFANILQRTKALTGSAIIKNNMSCPLFHRFEALKHHIGISVEEWLSNIANASFVITDSFHGAVFAILYNVPFVVKLNHTRGNARLESLLIDFELERCICRNVEDMQLPIIDWSKVNAHLKRRQTESMEFLIKALS